MSQDSAPQLTADQVATLVEILGPLKGKPVGPLPPELYEILAWIIPQNYLEIVPLRRENRNVQTLLIPRPTDDTAYPGQMHTPGSALRAGDFDKDPKFPLSVPIRRIQDGELGMSFAHEPQHVGLGWIKAPRGTGVHHTYMAQLLPDATLPAGSEWRDVDQLPQHPTFIQHQLPFIQMAARHFKAIFGN